jgi:tetratricopeptide (TPR) repeat protein
MRRELPADTHEAIARLSARGDEFAHDKKYDQAIAEYQKAWDLLPDPKTEWDAARWLLAAIGDAYFLDERFDRSLAFFTSAIVSTAGGLGNPFLHLRRGESLFELGRRDEAGDELMRAYMGAGPEIFKTEDAKYLAYLKTVGRL